MLLLEVVVMEEQNVLGYKLNFTTKMKIHTKIITMVINAPI